MLGGARGGAVVVYKARLKTDLVVSPAWAKRVEVKAGEVVQVHPCHDLQTGDGLYRFWVHPFTKTQKQAWGLYAQGPYGITAGADDFEYLDE